MASNCRGITWGNIFYMNKKDFEEYLGNLRWDSPKGVFDIAVKELSYRDDYDLSDLIAPFHYKKFNERFDNWKAYAQGCAIVICNKTDEQIIKLLPDLFTWFQDLNWPGGYEILTRLNKIPKEILEDYRQEAVKIATEENDEEWKEFLEYIDYDSNAD